MKLDIDRLKRELFDKKGILGRDLYFNSGVLVPLINIHNQTHLLFQKRAKGIRQESEICFPGGKYEPELDKDLRATAIRETCEELGINESEIDIISSMNSLVAIMGAIIDPFIGTINITDINQLKINRSEVESVFIIPIDDFINNKPEEYKVRVEVHPSFINDDGLEITLLPSRELGLPESYHSPWGTNNRRVLVYKTEFGVIWGITADIIYELISCLK